MGIMDNIFYIHLDISTTEFHDYYSNNINSVITKSHDGRKIQFPANILQPFVSHTGIQGVFKLIVDKNSKFKSISKIN